MTTRSRVAKLHAPHPAPHSAPRGPNAKPRPAKARFFFALRPDAEAATTLAASARRLAEAFGGRPIAADDLHLTLVFVGMRPIDDAQRLAGMLEALPAHIAGALPGDRLALRAAGEPVRAGDALPLALPLALSQLGSFGRGVLWVGPDERPPTAAAARTVAAMLSRWVSLLQRRLRAEGIEFDERPLRPHMTLVRGASDFERQGVVPRVVEPARWSPALGASDSASTPERRYRWVSRAAVTPA